MCPQGYKEERKHFRMIGATLKEKHSLEVFKGLRAKNNNYNNTTINRKSS